MAQKILWLKIVICGAKIDHKKKKVITIVGTDGRKTLIVLVVFLYFLSFVFWKWIKTKYSTMSIVLRPKTKVLTLETINIKTNEANFSPF